MNTISQFVIKRVRDGPQRIAIDLNNRINDRVGERYALKVLTLRPEIRVKKLEGLVLEVWANQDRTISNAAKQKGIGVSGWWGRTGWRLR